MSGTSNYDRDRRNTDQTAGEARIPVAEERLNVEKRPAELGEVRAHKTVTEEEQTVPVELEREEVRVEQRNIEDRPASGGDLFQEGTITVPVRGEEAVVQKEAVVTGEVVIGKERTTERQDVSDTVRRERVVADEDYDRYRGGFQQHFTGRQGQLQGQGGRWATRTWEEAEPAYRYGYDAGRHEQWHGREFDDVESDLRREYEGRYRTAGSLGGGSAGGEITASRGGTNADFAHGGADTGYEERTGQRQGYSGAGDDDWRYLRDEVREGWNRSRGR